MNYKLITAFIVTLLIAIIISCGEKTPSGPDTVTPPDTHTVGIPKNIKIDSLKIQDTVHTFQVYDTLNKTYHDTTFDTILGSFVAHWDTVLNAAQYFIFVHYNNGDFIRAQVSDTTRRVFIGGLIPDRSYFIKIAAVRYIPDTLPDTIIIKTIVGKKSDSASADLSFPLPPKRISASAAGNSVFISWTPSVSPYILGYDVYLADAHKPVTQKVAVDSATISVNFPVVTDWAYKVNVVTRTKIGSSPMCSSFVYDITTLQDTGFKLPYVYLSTYTRPDESNAGSTILGAGYMVGVKGGIFAMGNIWGDTTAKTMGKPVHEVVVSSFYLGSREISNALFVKFLNDFDTASLKVFIDTVESAVDTSYIHTFVINGDTVLKQKGPIYYDTISKSYAVKGDTVNYPVVGVYWEGAALYCNWLSMKDTLDACYNTSTWHCDTAVDGYRLPTEAEFEYAHSAAFLGTKQRYPWGYKDDVSKYSADNINLKKIGEYGQNYGFYDMSGNALEWCNDFSDHPQTGDSSYYAVCFKLGIVSNPTGPDTGVFRLLRGGSYKLKGAESSSMWRHNLPGINFSTYGFRVARSYK